MENSPPENLGFEKWLIEAKELSTDWRKFIGFTSLGKSLLIASLREKTTKPIIAVFPTKNIAREIVDNLSFLLGPKDAKCIHFIPSFEFDFFKGLLPNPETMIERNVSLFHAVSHPENQIFITTFHSLIQKGIQKNNFCKAIKSIKPNDEIDRNSFVDCLLALGYQRQPMAYDPGIFSIRGSVIDIYSPAYSHPVRINFYGDLIEDIRLFDPSNQRSLDPLTSAQLIPVTATLLPNNEQYSETANAIKERLDHQGISKNNRDQLIESIRNDADQSTYYPLMPLLSGGSSSLFEYLGKESLWIWEEPENIRKSLLGEELEKVQEHYRNFESEPSPIAEYSQLFLTKEEFITELNNHLHFSLDAFHDKNDSSVAFLPVDNLIQSLNLVKTNHLTTEAFDLQVSKLRDLLEQGFKIHLVCHSAVHCDRTIGLFEHHKIKSLQHQSDKSAFPHLLTAPADTLNIWQGAITESTVFPTLKLVLLSEEILFGKKKRRTQSPRWKITSRSVKSLASFRDLNENDFVVHKEHGIGKYLGLKSMNFQDVLADYALVEYRDGDKLYIPIYRLNVIQKYQSGESGQVVLDKMGGDRWGKVKQKAKSAASALAAELLELQAKRKLTKSEVFKTITDDFREFELEFPFDETPDQQKAIDDVLNDLGLAHPMDRLIVGDVGYGKTEVAMRAAFQVVSAGKQVAVLVPTTVLAYQHYESFKIRFKNTAVKIDMVSRLKTTVENKKSLEMLRTGGIDIIIGTHRLLSNDVIFKDLQLLILDEEHRFGVTHKEKLKKISAGVHLLSMSATPIPRTLNMAMAGVRDISLITTPPPDRLSIRTFVCRASNEVIREAILNETRRGGQVFYLHNRIESIYRLGENIKEILPDINYEIVHGQMPGPELERKMLDFYQNKFQVLLTTAIIESGLDVPKANTIIIDDAHQLGLAQLYQLRGRVGRANQRAYCYLLCPHEKKLSADAKYRLQVIQRYSELGAGFSIASHDLDLRGSGNLLGAEQSGHLNAIGIDLYLELLEESIGFLQGKAATIEIEPEINMKIPAYFPESYLPDISERVATYRNLSSVESDEEMDEISNEIQDRFGYPPEEVQNLIGLMRIKLFLKKLHVTHMNCGPKKTSLQFAASTPVTPETIIKIITNHRDTYSLTPDNKLVFSVENQHDWKLQLKNIQEISRMLEI